MNPAKLHMGSPLDIVICILPKIQPESPTVGPAVLKSHCEAAGFTATLRDLNIDLFESLGPENSHYWFESDDVFANDDLWEEFYTTLCSPIFDRWVRELLALKAQWIGLSVFSNRSARVAVKLITLLKLQDPAQQIVVGGAGTLDWHQSWAEVGADHWITGDGEHSLVALLRGNTDHAGIDGWRNAQIDDLDSLLYPNYDDIDFSRYHLHDPQYPKAYITGSRGCVRRCTFCDIASIWPNYRFRSGHNIAGELLMLRKKYGICDFEFTDSLVNGSLKAFRDMCSALADYRVATGDTNWDWSSQFICRSEQQMPADDYQLLKQSGCSLLSIGIESASYAVRKHMQKGFTDRDMWHTFDQCKKNDIRLSLMMLVGYPTETRSDFEKTLQFIKDLSTQGYFERLPNGRGRYISNFSFGPTMEIYHGTPIAGMRHELGIMDDADGNWTFGPANNIRVRIVRLLQAYATLESQGFGNDWWMAKRRNTNLKKRYTKITGRTLPDDILNYEESLEYDGSNHQTD